MNDPNGLIYLDGVYHMFFQHNPFGTDWGHMSWGHAISRDLVHWEELPVALHEENGVMAFSGSAVHDLANTSGFGLNGAGPAVLVFSGHSDAEQIQTQNLAYTNDGGVSFARYDANPVLDIGAKDFRDPHVFWHAQTGRWIMVVAYGMYARMYASPDLTGWEYLSDFGLAGTENAPSWECPQLLELPIDGNPDDTAWLLAMSVAGGATAGGSGMQYFVGTFNGVEFINANPASTVLWVDHGADFFAAQSFSAMGDGRCVWLGWMSNWAYAGKTPTPGWRGCMSVPREISLTRRVDGIRLRQWPVDEIETIRATPIYFTGMPGHPESSRIAVPDDAEASFDILVDFEAGNADRFGLRIKSSEFSWIEIGYDRNEGAIFVDRTRSGETAFSERFPAIHTVPLTTDEDGHIKLRVLVDACSVEVFADGGCAVITDLVFPPTDSAALELFADPGSSCKADVIVHTLRP